MSEFGKEIDAERLEKYLSNVFEKEVGPLTTELIAGGRSNPTYIVSNETTSWVLRRPPYGHVLPTAHNMEREARVLRALEDIKEVPVPKVLAFCQDEGILGAQFYIMENLGGKTLRTPEDASQLSFEERQHLSLEMTRVLSSLHTIRPAEVGLENFGRPNGYLERQLERWAMQWSASKTRERPIVDGLLQRLKESVPLMSRASIVHGDFKVDNLMINPSHPDQILGVLDWEMATLGDPLADLGLLISFWDESGRTAHPISGGTTALEGFMSREEIIHEYSRLTGDDVTPLDWYIVLAYVKVAIILEGIYARHLSGHTEGEDFQVGEMVDILLALADEHSERIPAGNIRV